MLQGQAARAAALQGPQRLLEEPTYLFSLLQLLHSAGIESGTADGALRLVYDLISGFKAASVGAQNPAFNALLGGY